MTGIHDIARATGVSTATVSRALRGLPNVSPETRRLIEAAAAEVGYVPSRSAAGLASGRHLAVAVVVPSMGRWFDTKVFEGVDGVLRRAGYDTFLINLAAGLNDRERLFHNALLRKRADGLIALGIDFTADEREEIRSSGMPSIIVGAPVPGVQRVGIDDEAAAMCAMRHLLDLGHRRIGYVGGENEYGMHHTVGEHRVRAWRRALAQHGVDADPAHAVMGAFRMPQAKVAARALLRTTDRPTAIFAASDEMAFGVLVAAAELELRVPDDLSVVGIDDHDWSESVGLTTVHQDPFEQGRLAASIVIEELTGEPAGSRAAAGELRLIVRHSTAAPRDVERHHRVGLTSSTDGVAGNAEDEGRPSVAEGRPS